MSRPIEARGSSAQALLPLAEAEALVRKLIAAGDTKAAVERARAFHDALATGESETLAVEAYRARIAALRARGLSTEARALVDVACNRFARARARRAVLEAVAEGRASLDDRLAELARPDLPDARRAELEVLVRRELEDPAAVASSPGLPEGHPLRIAAAAVVKVLAAAAAGPVAAEALALPEVSRRSPLAPWKLLARAIACFHGRDDAACEQALAAIDPASPPARVAPLLRALLAGKTDEARGPAAGALVSRVQGERRLVEALTVLDQRLRRGVKRKRALEAVRSAAALCRETAPDLQEELRRRVSVRALLAGLPAEAVKDALGGPAPRDARFSRLHARALEALHQDRAAFVVWSAFRRAAIDEGWFPERSPEAAAVDVAMAERAARLEPSDRSRPELEREARDVLPAGWSIDPALIDPAELYRRAADADPNGEVYERWLAIVRGSPDGFTKAGDEVAKRWSEALPGDPRPLLHLAASAEERGALATALDRIAAAERLDPVNPAVRGARWRLHVAAAIRHAKQGKPHLVENDAAALAALAGGGHAQRPALIAALRRVAASIAGRDAAPLDEDIVRLAGREGGRMLIRELGRLANGPVSAKGLASSGHAAPGHAATGLAAEIAAVCALGADAGLELRVPREHVAALREELASATLEPEALLALAEAALRGRELDLAFAASGAGLSREGVATARFLIARARSLPDSAWLRREHVLLAAAELGRRQRDADVTGEALGALEMGGAPDPTGPASPEAVIERERTLDAKADEEEYRALCRCAGLCRRALLPFFASDWDDGAEDDADEDMEADAALLLELVRKFGPDHDPEEVKRRDPDLFRRVQGLLERERGGKRGGRCPDCGGRH